MPRRTAVSEMMARAAREVQQRVSDEREVKLPDVKQALIDEIKNDAELLDRFLDESLGPLVYDVCQRVVQRTRGMVVFGDLVLPVQEVRKAARRATPSWSTWLEHTGDRYVRLVDMGPHELQLAENSRLRRIHSEAGIVALLRELRKRVPEGMTVGQVMTHEQLDALATSLDVRVTITGETPDKGVSTP